MRTNAYSWKCHSKLVGILAALSMTKVLCTYFLIDSGSLTVGSNSTSAIFLSSDLDNEIPLEWQTTISYMESAGPCSISELRFYGCMSEATRMMKKRPTS